MQNVRGEWAGVEAEVGHVQTLTMPPTLALAPADPPPTTFVSHPAMAYQSSAKLPVCVCVCLLAKATHMLVRIHACVCACVLSFKIFILLCALAGPH